MAATGASPVLRLDSDSPLTWGVQGMWGVERVSNQGPNNLHAFHDPLPLAHIPKLKGFFLLQVELQLYLHHITDP